MALGFSFPSFPPFLDLLLLFFSLPLFLSLSLRWPPRSWQAACPAGQCAPRGRTSSPRQSAARLRSRLRPRRTPRPRRQQSSHTQLCTASVDTKQEVQLVLKTKQNTDNSCHRAQETAATK